MSHFAGLVITSDAYESKNTWEESLEEYWADKEVPEYLEGELSDFNIISFLSYVKSKQDPTYNVFDVRNEFVNLHIGCEGYKHEEFYDNIGFSQRNNVACVVFDHKQEYSDFWKSKYPEVFADFERLYNEYGDEWNCHNWKINPETNKWCSYLTQNPNGKWSWYEFGGRWSSTLKTKDGKFVDKCLLEELDWTPFKQEDYCKRLAKDYFGNKFRKLKQSVKWHFNENDVPFCLIVDGQWYEKGTMKGWAMVDNEKENWDDIFNAIMKTLDPKSHVRMVDFHQ